MEFEWDGRKAASNLTKHGVDFADAVTVLDDELAVTVRDDSGSEERYVTIGMDATGRLVVVVYAWRGERVRIISARRPTSTERKSYEG
ncbi:MAG: BrnT family toxin [Vicinamibacteria bacterium]